VRTENGGALGDLDFAQRLFADDTGLSGAAINFDFFAMAASAPQAPEIDQHARTGCRSHVIRIFPNPESCLRLMQALAVEIHEDCRYLNMELLREHKKLKLVNAA
jgi:hypothetical protein